MIGAGPLRRLALAIAAGGGAVASVLDQGPVPRHPHPEPAAALLAGVLLLGVEAVLRWRRRDATRWMVELGAGAALAWIAALAGAFGVALLVVKAWNLHGENAMGALIPGIVGGALLAALVVALLQRRRSRRLPRARGEAAALTFETLAALLLALVAWGLGTSVVEAARSGTTPLLWAAREGHPDLVARLTERGADPNSADDLGETPLVAALTGCGPRLGAPRLAIVATLLRAGADPDRAGPGGDTPLCRAVGDDPDLVRALLAGGADPDVRCPRGTPLHLAAEWGRPEPIALLLENAAAVDTPDGDGRTALMRAVATSSWASGADERLLAARRLLEADAGLAARDQRGRTPLHWAALGGDPALVELLVEAGADPGARDEWQRSPLDAALGPARDAVEGPALAATPLRRDAARLERVRALLSPDAGGVPPTS